MMKVALEKLPGQQVYLFTEDAKEFYKTLGLKRGAVGLELVVGTWLVNALGLLLLANGANQALIKCLEIAY